MDYFQKNKNEIFKKYEELEIIKDINSYKNGDGKLQKTLNQFFEELVFESCGRGSSVSPMDVLLDDAKIAEIFEYIKTKPNFYKGTDIQNLKSYFRNAVSWVRKVANFDPKQARLIQNRYNNDKKSINVLDTSAGFGSRMSAALLSGNNYCGIDPNQKLFAELVKYGDFIKKNKLSDNFYLLLNTGSEVFHERLVSKFDISFTSPPYFNLEKYSSEQFASTKNYDNYEYWVKDFVIPTVRNTYLYLKVGGHAMINIKNINKKNPLFDDFHKAFSDLDGFVFVETFDMSIASKKNYGMAGKCEIPTKEPVMVFKKVR